MELSDSLVMVVDDAQANVDLLVDILDDEYRVSVAMDGEDAISFAKEDLPDLILLDVMMPGVDGFEVAQRLKTEPTTRDIPIIFVTAKGEEVDEAKGFRLGAVDYLVKPVSPLIVKARVRNHLELRRARLAVEQQNRLLEVKVAERTAALAEANSRLSVLDQIKNDFLNMLDHELRTPLHGILGATEFLLETSPPFAEKEEFAGFYRQGRARIEQLLNDSKLIQTLDTDASSQYHNVSCFPLGRLLDEVCLDLKDIKVEQPTDGGLSERFVHCDRELLRRALRIFLQIASCFQEGGNGPVALSLEQTDDRIILVFSLGYQHLNSHDAAHFFDIAADVRTRSKAQQLGLSPVLAARIVGHIGGSAVLEKGEGYSGRLLVYIPLCSPEHEATSRDWGDAS